MKPGSPPSPTVFRLRRRIWCRRDRRRHHQGPLNICITAWAKSPGQALRRDGAQVGDQVWVSGRPGLAALGLAHLQGKVGCPSPGRACASPRWKTAPAVALGQALLGIATAAIDVSDGPLADLGHLRALAAAPPPSNSCNCRTCAVYGSGDATMPTCAALRSNARSPPATTTSCALPRPARSA